MIDLYTIYSIMFIIDVNSGIPVPSLDVMLSKSVKRHLNLIPSSTSNPSAKAPSDEHTNPHIHIQQ